MNSNKKTHKTSERLKFPKKIRQAGWRICFDENRDEIIPLTKGSNGDHIYPMSRERFGVWVSRKKISRLIFKLKKVDGCIVEQLGDREAVLSWPFEKFDEIARFLHAARKKKVTRKLRSHLNSISTFSAQKPYVQNANNQRRSTNKGGGHVNG